MLLIGLFLFIIGSALGSFSLVLAWRMHAGADWVRGRSKCDKCGHILEPKDLVPIFSWLYLRGKCRYCKKKLPKSLILAEVLMGLTASLSWLFWPYEVTSPAGYIIFILWLIIATVLSALLWYDMRWFILPDKLVLALLLLAIVFRINIILVQPFNLQDSILIPLLSALFLSGLFFALFILSKQKWIGFGDVKLAIPLGLILSTPLNSWLMLFMASIIGLLLALPNILAGKTKMQSKIPFGPSLIIATFFTFIFGQDIVDFYLRISGL